MKPNSAGSGKEIAGTTHYRFEARAVLNYVIESKFRHPERSRRINLRLRAVSFKILPDPKTTDFPAKQFGTFQTQAIARFDSDKMQRLFPYKNICQGFWGDRAESTVGTVITDDMFSPVLRKRPA